MPSGKTHDTLTLVTGLTLVPVSLIISPAETLVLVATHCVSGLLFSPDLDLRSKPYYRWGWLRGLWVPYQHMFHHRSKYTHGLLFGPVIRLLYFFVLLAPLLWYFHIHLSLSDQTWHPALVGWFTGSWVHSISDSVVSKARQTFKTRLY